MPVPFRDADDVEELGAAAFLRIQTSSGGSQYVGALFLINARGEPLEFAYNRLQTPHTFLWRQADLRRQAERRLAASLLSICPRVPKLVLCLADEVGGELFSQDIELSLPVGRIGQPLKATAFSANETQELVDGAEPLHLFWFPRPPAEGSVERQLFVRLSSHSLLLEPFERALIGLKEVFPPDVGEAAPQ